MSNAYPAIAASESKSSFMAGIGLTSGTPNDERIYKLMKEDAVDAYRKVVQVKWERSSLIDGSNVVKPRYGYTEIPKNVIEEAIVTIYSNASPEAKLYYDRGRDGSGGDSNWVIRWMLWHTFRYRDSRNKRASVATERAILAEGDPGETAPQDTDTLQGSMDDSCGRGTWIAASEAAANLTTRGRSLPFDPTRGD